MSLIKDVSEVLRPNYIAKVQQNLETLELFVQTVGQTVWEDKSGMLHLRHDWEQIDSSDFFAWLVEWLIAFVSGQDLTNEQVESRNAQLFENLAICIEASPLDAYVHLDKLQRLAKKLGGETQLNNFKQEWFQNLTPSRLIGLDTKKCIQMIEFLAPLDKKHAARLLCFLEPSKDLAEAQNSCLEELYDAALEFNVIPQAIRENPEALTKLLMHSCDHPLFDAVLALRGLDNLPILIDNKESDIADLVRLERNLENQEITDRLDFWVEASVLPGMSEKSKAALRERAAGGPPPLAWFHNRFQKYDVSLIRNTVSKHIRQLKRNEAEGIDNESLIQKLTIYAQVKEFKTQIDLAIKDLGRLTESSDDPPISCYCDIISELSVNI